MAPISLKNNRFNDFVFTKLYPSEDSIARGKFPDILFNDCTLSDAGLFDVCKAMYSSESERIVFDSERTIIPLDMGYFIISYRSEDIRNSDKEAFQKTGCCTYDELMGGVQMPKICGYFNINKPEPSYCLILGAHFELKEINNHLVYKSIVLLPVTFNQMYS